MLNTLSTCNMALHENATMTFPVLILLTLVCCSCGTSTMANEIDTRNNLYLQAVEVYLRQHGLRAIPADVLAQRRWKRDHRHLDLGLPEHNPAHTGAVNRLSPAGEAAAGST